MVAATTGFGEIEGYVRNGSWGAVPIPDDVPQSAKGEGAVTLTDVTAAAEKAGRNAVKGADGWLFFRGEMRSVAVGRFWGEELRHPRGRLFHR
mgnify:CR=1 FL=1